MKHLFPLALVLALCACAPKTPDNARPWRAFVLDLVDPSTLPDLDAPGTTLISSYDRSGRNDDFNYFQRPGTEPGWYVIADLKGPGCVRRFWTTGMRGNHPFRFYFDGERKPRLEGPVDEIFGARFPGLAPLARSLNMCWSSYVPLTYQKSLRIEALGLPPEPSGSPGKLFYQIGVESRPASAPVETYPRTFSPQDLEAVDKVIAEWKSAVEPKEIAWPADSPSIEIAAGASAAIYTANGPGLITLFDLQVQPDDPSAWTHAARQLIEQDVVLRVRYDGLDFASIETPLGYFFGNTWRKRSLGSLLCASTPTGFRSRFPMPFQKAVSVELVNRADRAVRVRSRFENAAAPGPGAGYLHAFHEKSGPEPGRPHRLADFPARGKLVGTVLDVTSHDDSWWILEGDESMRVDGEMRPSWHGTGLEDYFNGGWYYRGSAFEAFNGILDRAPFRVTQYRHHVTDPVRFSKSLQFEIERGDQNVSRGYFQSTVLAYLSEPKPMPAVPADAVARRTADHPFQRQSFMLQLVELERMNNFREAIAYLDEYLEKYPGSEEAGVYRLRQLEYRRLLGEAVADDELAPYVSGEFGDQAAEQARLLQWFYEKPGRALIAANINAKGEVFLDGQKVLDANHPYALVVKGMELSPGSHALSARAEVVRPEPWLLMSVRTSDGLVGTGPGTWTLPAANAPSDWTRANAKLDDWPRAEPRNVVRGTPDAPYVGSVPDAFVLLPSKAYSIRAPEWGYAYRGPAYYHVNFDLPLKGWPTFTPLLTGLSR